ncbi:hypothetical protein [Methanosphaerula palustris]|uniref:hypothetical protein n=1 Tax=Methanosphaerula palustris TaxID=475088 RepID=UPI0011D15A98|nr:hypothetical protein [Methanosphaerula palustris]
MVEHEPGALLVGVVEGHRPGARIGHVGDVHDTDTLRVRRVLTGRGDPLLRRAIADPGGGATMEVDVRTVLRVIHRHGVHAERAHACAHDGGVDGQEEVAAGAGGQFIGELDPDRPVALGHDRRAEVGDRRDVLTVLHLDVSAESGRREVGVQLLGVLPEFDLIVVGAGIGRRVRDGDGEARQCAYELPDAAGECAADGGVELGVGALRGRGVRDVDDRGGVARAGVRDINARDGAGRRVGRGRGRGARAGVVEVDDLNHRGEVPGASVGYGDGGD